MNACFDCKVEEQKQAILFRTAAIEAIWPFPPFYTPLRGYRSTDVSTPPVGQPVGAVNAQESKREPTLAQTLPRRPATPQAPQESPPVESHSASCISGKTPSRSYEFRLLPTSSNTSRTAAPQGSSSGSIPPPGTIHWSGWRLLLTSNTCRPTAQCQRRGKNAC